jgi:hypothetical protein
VCSISCAPRARPSPAMNISGRRPPSACCHRSPGEVAQQQRARRGPAGPRAEREDDLGHLGRRACVSFS